MTRSEHLFEQLEVLRRVSRRGKRLAEEDQDKDRAARYLDIFNHLDNELQLTKQAAEALRQYAIQLERDWGL